VYGGRYERLRCSISLSIRGTLKAPFLGVHFWRVCVSPCVRPVVDDPSVGKCLQESGFDDKPVIRLVRSLTIPSVSPSKTEDGSLVPSSSYDNPFADMLFDMVRVSAAPPSGDSAVWQLRVVKFGVVVGMPEDSVFDMGGCELRLLGVSESVERCNEGDELIWGEVGVRRRTMVKPTEALRVE
jgi:hypothetical protein